MRVLSLFDGISGGALALDRAGIPVNQYYASEIDKHCLAITQNRFPHTIQLGDVTNWRQWDLPKIDLLMGGTPCQGFSSAGKGLNFEDPRSKLFFTYVDILKTLKPTYFLMENVKMKKEWQDVISNLLGVEPILIDSSLLSAQHRQRLYWTNIPNVTQPEDKNILLKDILEGGVVDRQKDFCLDACYYKGGNLKQYFEKSRRQLVFSDEIALAASMRGRRSDLKGIRHDYDKSIPAVQRIEIRDDPTKTGALTTVQKDNILLYKSGWRNLTPLECERLQTLPDGFTNVTGVAKSHRYKAVGNGWTVDVIAHILKGLKLQL